MKETTSSTVTQTPTVVLPGQHDACAVEKALKTLVAAAIQAPSGDNLQPWRFQIDPQAGRVTLCIDEARDPSPMNAGQWASRIAVGAALENMLLTAEHNGWDVALEEPHGEALAAVRLSHFDTNNTEVELAITTRVTNRRPYDGRPLPQDLLERLQGQTARLDGIHTHWIHDRRQLASLASLVSRADALMFGEPSMRHAFLSNVRFDQPCSAEVDQGLSLNSLEVSAVQQIGLRIMARTPDRLLRLTGAMRIFAMVASKLVQSASGLCLITQEDATPPMDVLAGRAMQQAWLTLTANGLAVQPMMSLPLFENLLRCGTSDLLDSLGRDRTVALLDEFHALTPEIGDGHPAFLMRFGFAPPPSGRTGRLQPSASTTTGTTLSG